MSLIRVNNLTKTYTTDEVETPVLRGVSFSIEPGEFVAIMGPSGSGKSTLLHVLGFLDTQTGGDYIYRDKKNIEYDAAAVATLRNERIGFIFQAFNLLPRTTVYDNVQLPLLYSHVPPRDWDARILSAIEVVGLSHRARHFSGQLSGGEKQRVAIARALVTNPELIFADEPTGNLDSVSSRAVMEFLRELHAKGGHTIILITHETSTAQYANRIIRLHDGQIVEDTKVDRTMTGEKYSK
jgi:putative ABC transport system ATP-binding protein